MKGVKKVRLFTESDIFDYLNKDNVLQSRIFKILNNKSGALVINEKLKPDLDTIQKVYRETSTLMFLSAIKANQILLVDIPLEYNLPECLPFIKHKKDGKKRIIINVSQYVNKRKDPETGDIEYSMDVKKLYVLCLSGYIYLKLLYKDTVLPPDTIKYSAFIWARMFNKVLIKTIGLSTNKERYEAFMYFAIRFFMKYYLECPDIVVDNISSSYLKNGKSYLIEFMETKISDLNIDPYESFSAFCSTLFNNEISNIKGIRVNNINENINISFYIKKFIDMYNLSAAMSLSSYPFFLFTIIASYNWTGICNDRSMEDIVQYDKKEVPKLLNSIYKELK